MRDAAAARWVLASSTATRRAHLDLGERSSQSLRVHAEHVIVTACRAHLAATAEEIPESYRPLCSNCMRIARTMKENAATPMGDDSSRFEHEREADTFWSNDKHATKPNCRVARRIRLSEQLLGASGARRAGTPTPRLAEHAGYGKTLTTLHRAIPK